MSNFYNLSQLGWQPYFQQQLSLEQNNHAHIARIVEQQKSVYLLQLSEAQVTLEIIPTMPKMVVGDWLLLDDNFRFSKLLERKTSIVRKAAGLKSNSQLIAANVDTVFIVCSLNEDFNLNRIERYLTLVKQVGSEAVILLTKSDLISDVDSFIEQIHSLDSFLMVEAINCHSTETLTQLAPWLKPGSTLAVIGSSGVGKSTLTNLLLGSSIQETGAIRMDDGKGRHTTTTRSLHICDSGFLILDTPGMREVQLIDCEHGLNETFKDIAELANSCRFHDCRHDSEPQCAVRDAIEEGSLSQRRFDNFIKLQREQAHNSATAFERRTRDKALSQMYKSHQNQARFDKGK